MPWVGHQEWGDVSVQVDVNARSQIRTEMETPSRNHPAGRFGAGRNPLILLVIACNGLSPKSGRKSPPWFTPKPADLLVFGMVPRGGFEPPTRGFSVRCFRRSAKIEQGISHRAETVRFTRDQRKIQGGNFSWCGSRVSETATSEALRVVRIPAAERGA